MLVNIKVFTSLRHYLPQSKNHVEGDTWDIPKGSTLAQVLKILQIPDKEVKVLLVNGRRGAKGSVLNEGDVFHVFPPLMGG